MTTLVRFEEEADVEYRAAGLWYEERRFGLGTEFFDAVDAAVDQLVNPRACRGWLPRFPATRFRSFARVLHGGLTCGAVERDDLGRLLTGQQSCMAVANSPHHIDGVNLRDFHR